MPKLKKTLLNGRDKASNFYTVLTNNTGTFVFNKTQNIKRKLFQVGFITSMTENFCGSCNRLRMTADGNLVQMLLNVVSL
jgi:molybdenum cofactor biosynthesis enzyme MoaA